MKSIARAAVIAVSLLILVGCGAKTTQTKTTTAPGSNEDAFTPAQQEAAKTLLLLYENSGYYYTAPRVAAGTGMKIECQFPSTRDWTPAGSPCANPDKKFAAEPKRWMSDTWAALDFQMNDSHFAAYKIESSGTVSDATITMRARFDSDCDGQWEELSITMKPESSYTHAECTPAPNPAALMTLRAMLPIPHDSEALSPAVLARVLSLGSSAHGIRSGGERRSPNVEVVDELLALHRMAAIYYTTPRVARRTGNKLPCQFPETNDWTPAGTPCANSDKMFDVEAMQWASDTWSAMNFQMNDRHFAAYKVVSSGTLGDAQIRFMARTDTDCDGKWEVYTKALYGDKNSSMHECSIRSGSSMIEGPH